MCRLLGFLSPRGLLSSGFVAIPSLSSDSGKGAPSAVFPPPLLDHRASCGPSAAPTPWTPSHGEQVSSARNEEGWVLGPGAVAALTQLIQAPRAPGVQTLPVRRASVGLSQVLGVFPTLLN